MGMRPNEDVAWLLQRLNAGEEGERGRLMGALEEATRHAGRLCRYSRGGGRPSSLGFIGSAASSHSYRVRRGVVVRHNRPDQAKNLDLVRIKRPSTTNNY